MKINTIIYLVLAEQTQLDCSGAPPPLYFRCIFSGGPSLVIAPAGLPSEVEDKLHKAAIKTLRSAELKKQSADPGNPRRNIEGESPLHGKDTRSEVLPKRVRVVSDHRPGPMLWCAPIVFGANSEKDRCAPLPAHCALCQSVPTRISVRGARKPGEAIMLQTVLRLVPELPLFLVTAAVTHLVMSFAQTLMHYKLGHHSMGGKFFRNHINFHHTYYSKDHLVSRTYLGDEGNNTPFFFVPVFLVGACTYFVLPVDLFAVQVVACALSFYAHVFFDKEYHVEGSRMQRFAWFRRKQELHFVHHRHANSNFAVIHFFWDRVLGTYRRPDTRQMDSTQNQVPFLPNRAPLSEGW